MQSVTLGPEDMTSCTVSEANGVPRTRSGTVQDTAIEATTNDPSYEVENNAQEKDDDGVNYAYQTKAVEYWRGCTSKKRRSFRNVQTKFKKAKSLSVLKTWEQIVRKGGSLQSKLQEGDRIVKERFDEAEVNGSIVHDIDLRTWGTEASQGGLPDFKASSSWVSKFKLRHGMSGRKVTKYVTANQITEETDTSDIAERFVANVKTDIQRVDEVNTFNSDQSGFNFELHSGRTLHTTGAKKVIAVVQRTNSTTHSYTVQHIINAAGEFSKPMLMVLPESSGTFGPIVQRHLFQAPNIKRVANKSGKCTSEILQSWYKDIFLPQVSADSIILLDAFGGFNKATDGPSTSEEDIDEGEFNIRVHRIPKGTTGMIQPLDVYGFRPYKNIFRKISDKIILTQQDFEMGVRNNVIKLQSLVFNIICSPRLKEMFKYGWYKAGYISTHPKPFATPAEYCFPQGPGNCERDCGETSFIRCSWCSQGLCFQHFVHQYHLCENFKE